MNKKEGSIFLANVKRYWLICMLTGSIFWFIAIILWQEQSLDNTILFYFDPARIADDPIIVISQFFSSYGMAIITIFFILYLVLSRFMKSLDAPQTIYFYTICSFALSGIAGDLLKQVLARPRPFTTFGNAIFTLSQSASYAIPSGHATKSIALVLPFLFLVSSTKNIHKTIYFIILAIAGGICFSRIALGAHYLSDVVAGIGTALIGFPFSIQFANMVLRNVDRKRLKKLAIVWAFLLVFLTAVFMVL